MTLVRQSPASTRLSWGVEEAAALRRGLAALGLDATPGQFARLETYAGLLLKWNRTYNLLGATTARDLIDSHLLDSLATLPALSRWLPTPTATTCPVLFDIGSGAGLPGLALAIMLPEQPIARVIEGRIEDLAPAAMAPGDRQAGPDAAADASVLPSFICRAFTSLERFAALCRPHAGETSRLFAMKAARVAEEVAELTAGEVLAVEPLPIVAPGVQRNLVVMQPGRAAAARAGTAANPA